MTEPYKCALLSGFPLELKLQRTHLLRLRFGSRTLFRFLLQQRGSLCFNSFNVSGRRLNGEIARQQIIASITSSDPDDLAARAEVIYIFTQKYFRVCHLRSPIP